MTFASSAVIWLVAAIVLAVIELSTMGLITIWFAIGAVVAMLAALIGANIWVQLVLFILVSMIVLIAVRPLAEKYLNKKVTRTNIDAVIGKRLVAKTDIDSIKGKGKVDYEGSTWLAATENEDEIISAGEEVVVVKVQGVKLIVKKAD